MEKDYDNYEKEIKRCYKKISHNYATKEAKLLKDSSALNGLN